MPPSAAPEAPSRAAARVRFSRPKGAWLASIAAHAGVLGALSLAPAPLKGLPPDPVEPPSAGQGLYVHAKVRWAYPIPRWIRACFSQDELPVSIDYLRGYEDIAESETFEEEAGEPAGSARSDLPSFALRVNETPDWPIAQAVIECAQQASDAGWSGHGRAIVHVERHAQAGRGRLAQLGVDEAAMARTKTGDQGR